MAIKREGGERKFRLRSNKKLGDGGSNEEDTDSQVLPSTLGSVSTGLNILRPVPLGHVGFVFSTFYPRTMHGPPS
jgi:hypothetical protein